MTTRAERWKQRQKTAADRAATVALRTAQVRAYWFRPGFRVQIEGENLFPALSPPRVQVAGIPVADLRFADDGTRLTGRLPDWPSGREVAVDYGFARGDFRLDREVSRRPALADLLPEIWELLVDLLRRRLGPRR